MTATCDLGIFGRAGLLRERIRGHYGLTGLVTLDQAVQVTLKPAPRATGIDLGRIPEANPFEPLAHSLPHVISRITDQSLANNLFCRSASYLKLQKPQV